MPTMELHHPSWAKDKDVHSLCGENLPVDLWIRPQDQRRDDPVIAIARGALAYCCHVDRHRSCLYLKAVASSTAKHGDANSGNMSWKLKGLGQNLTKFAGLSWSSLPIIRSESGIGKS